MKPFLLSLVAEAYGGLGLLQKKLAEARAEVSTDGAADPQAAMSKLTEAEQTVLKSSIAGDRKTLVADSAIPATMAAIYLLLMVYFKAIGGYKAVHLSGTEQAKADHDDVEIPAHEG